jgi:hypothetical protein
MPLGQYAVVRGAFAFSLRPGYLTASVYPGCIRIEGHLYTSICTAGLDTQRYTCSALFILAACKPLSNPVSNTFLWRGSLLPLGRAAALKELAGVLYSHFLRCDACQRVYWEGSHWRGMCALLAPLLDR